jgi:hypothetical protein
MLAGEHRACPDDTLVRIGEVADQNVEMRGGTGGTTLRRRAAPPPPWNESRWPCGGGSSVTQPGYHCTGVPPSSPAQNPARSHGSGRSSTISRIQPIGPAV